MRRRLYLNDEYETRLIQSDITVHINESNVDLALSCTFTICLSKIFYEGSFKQLPTYLDEYKYSPHYFNDFDVSLLYYREDMMDSYVMIYNPSTIENDSNTLNYDYIKEYLKHYGYPTNSIPYNFYITCNNFKNNFFISDYIVFKSFNLWDNTNKKN